MASQENKEHPGQGASPQPLQIASLVATFPRTLPLRRLPLDVARDGRDANAQD